MEPFPEGKQLNFDAKMYSFIELEARLFSLVHATPDATWPDDTFAGVDPILKDKWWDNLGAYWETLTPQEKEQYHKIKLIVATRELNSYLKWMDRSDTEYCQRDQLCPEYIPKGCNK